MFDDVKAYYKKLVPDLPEEAWLALESTLTIQHLKKGEFLIREGEICKQVSFLNSGFLRFFYLSPEGKEINTGFVGKHEYASEYSSFLTQSPSSMNIEALEDTDLVNLSYNAMQKGYGAFSFFERFGRKIAERLFISLSNANTRLLTLTPEQRYRWVVENQPAILQIVPQYMIASYIGISAEHLSRLRKKMAERSS